MKTVKVTLAGKTYELPANNSGWISDSEVSIDPKVIQLLRDHPRTGTGPKGEPVITDDAGRKIHLGSASLRLPDEKIQQGPGVKKTELVNFCQEVLAYRDKLSDESKKFLDAVLESQRASMDKVKATLGSMSQEDLKALFKSLIG